MPDDWSWWTKAKRAASELDDETWKRGGVCPTLNDFDNGSESRATVLSLRNGGRDSDSRDGRTGIGLDEVAHTLQSEQQHAVIAFSHTQGLDAQPSTEATPTLRKEGGGQAVSSPSAVRRLTPRECEALQGFPPDWTAGQADSARYRQMGNAVAVPVVEWIMRRLVEVDDD